MAVGITDGLGGCAMAARPGDSAPTLTEGCGNCEGPA